MLLLAGAAQPLGAGDPGALPLRAAPAMAGGPVRPNIVLILADDLDDMDLRAFPNIHAQLVRQGATFDRYFVTNPWCCPSRSTILRSQYVHSHQVLTNTGPEGGFVRFYEQGLERSTIGSWMQASGYRTALMGKYLNHFPGEAVPKTYVPPGWDEWYVPVRRLYQEFDYTLNENGTLREYGSEPEDYLADVLSAKAQAFVKGRSPFFLYLAPIAPHRPANPAPRHEDAFEDAQAPRPPSFDQPDVTREPLWLRSLPRIGERAAEDIDELYQERLRAMLGVDDMVGALVEALRASGRLQDTYIFFTSDNGFHLGQHRLTRGKTSPYEESIKVPLIVRGPGVRPGSRVPGLAASVDLGPTFTDLAGVATPGFVEGRSLVPLLAGRTPDRWRTGVLVEFYRPGGWVPTRASPVPPYTALRTTSHTYVEYSTGEQQLFDLTADPHQLRNIVSEAPPEFLDRLRSQMRALSQCSGASCRVADGQ
ncbi:arylsulfatase A-like enzyme [Thermocatellispora tengchongensis]|uniref:Arylsulfatase A-like enzyme n=2 Tax=Thermocatellispora tengchongensis TaxID=1073253 RepID=A0A840PBJ2_9ACTN|nr:sulfatase [Thermocatellispora tengchongensis]MBB5136369.1 arylsulfatase A-like enzyme [Thermocatellispora tengchongensis]